MRANHWISVGAFVCAGVVASANLTAGTVEPVRFPATVVELMDTRIDPAADALWDSVAFIATAKGEEDRRPRTSKEWATVRHSATALIDAASDLELPGWRVSPVETTPGVGELRASEIQHLIEADPAAFAKRARALGAATRVALAAIDAKDADGLLNAGGVIDAACEACHIVYWYPAQLKDRR